MRWLAPRSVLPLAALLLAALSTACAVEGTTADCTNNITADGVTNDPEGCQKFAVCDQGSPAECCKDIRMDSCEYQFCLFGYGEPRTAEMEFCLNPGGGSGGGGGGS